MADGLRDIVPRKPLRFTIDPLTLKQLCSQKIVVTNFRYKIEITSRKYAPKIWNAFLNCYRYYELKIEAGFGGIDKKTLHKILDDHTILCFADEIDRWMCRNLNFYSYYDLTRNTHILNCTEDLEFNSFGSVSSLRTAKNLLIGDKLSIVEKYRVACINCLIDDVKYFWPLVCDDPRVNRYNDPLINYNREHPLIYYWTGMMKGEPHRFSGIDNDMRWRREHIFRLCEWPGIEYVFDVLTEDEQVEAALHVIYNYSRRITERSNMFLKLNTNEKLFHKVMEKISIADVFNHQRLRCSEKLALSLWNDMKYLINVNHFADLIRYFLFEESHGCWEYTYPLLFDIWISAPNHLKKYVTNNVQIVEEIFVSFNSDFYQQISSLDIIANRVIDVDLRFFHTLMTDLSYELRNSLWCKYWTRLIVSGRPEFLGKLMKLCFRNTEEIIRFKENEMMNFRNIKLFCHRLIETGYIRWLMNYLDFCSTNVDRVRALKRKIIMSSKIQSSFLRSNLDNLKVIFFDLLIDSAFTSDDDAIKFKMRLSESSEKIKTIYSQIGKKYLGAFLR